MKTIADGVAHALASRPEVPGALLFACTMNSVRSPMAAAIMGHLAGHRCYVQSAGVRPGEPDPFIVEVMGELGIDVSRHKPHSFDDLNDSSFDLVITLTPEAHHRALELTRTNAMDVEYWPTLDPTLSWGTREQILDNYRACRDSLFRRIKERFHISGGPTI